MCVRMYACMYVCTYARMYVCMHVSIYVRMHVRIQVRWVDMHAHMQWVKGTMGAISQTAIDTCVYVHKRANP